MTKKSKTIVSLLLFVLLFGGMLITATFTDLQVSKLLTAGVLAPGEYYTNSFFGAVFESVGSAPVYLMIAFAVQILFWNIYRFWKKQPWKTLLLIVGVCGNIGAYFAFFNETLGYVMQHVDAESFKGSAYLMGIAVMLAIMVTFFGIFAAKNFSDESLKKLLNMAFAVLATVIVANIIVAIVKIPVGRMRYRAMNTEGGQSIGGFKNFTRWYIANGQRDKTEMMTLFGTTDACKSFPSGHTCAAGMCYGLIMLIDVFEIKSKGKKAAIWIGTIAFTGLVAVSRIMVGAHYFSDVLMGGTISFVCMIISREIFICKGSHVKALFKK